MATVTDTLETVLKLIGTSEMTKGLSSVAATTELVAAASATATTATTGFGAALAAVAGPILATVGKTVALTLFLGKAIQAFGEADLTAVRVGQTMKNLGNVFPTNDLLAFADALSKTTGIDDELIATLGATAAQFGLTRQQIEKLLPVVLDTAQLKGLDPAQVLSSILRASRGRAQGLIAIGIDPAKIKGDIKNIDNLVSQIGGTFAGGAAAVRNTIPGALQGMQTSLENLFEAIGSIYGGWVKLINATSLLIDRLTSVANFLALLFKNRPLFGGGTTFTPAGQGTGGPNLALKGDPEQSKYLKDIADNTDPKKQADALAQEVLGGPGTVAAGATNWRDFNMAMGV